MTAVYVSAREVFNLCRWQGLTPDEAVTAVVVAEAASGLDAHFQMLGAPGEESTYRGLFGIEIHRDDPLDRMGLLQPTRNVTAALDRYRARGRSWSSHWVWPIEKLDELRERVIVELGGVYDRDAGEPAERAAERAEA